MTEPNPAGGAKLETYYSYNVLDKLTQVSMPRDGYTQTRQFQYDPAGRLTQATNPENGTVNYAYNADGTLNWRTDAKNQRVEYSYDSYRRVIQIRRFPIPTWENPGERVNFYYDANPLDPSFTQYGWGRMTAASYGGGSPGELQELYSYTPAGQLARKRLRLTRNGATGTLEASWLYDNEGRMTSMTYPSWHEYDYGSWVLKAGSTYTYSYDAMGRPTRLSEYRDGQYDWVRNVSYGPAGEMLHFENQAEVDPNYYYSENRTYNSRVQLTGINGVATGLTVNIGYTYSPAQNNGRITQASFFGETVAYTYDTLNRLTRAETTGPQLLLRSGRRAARNISPYSRYPGSPWVDRRELRSADPDQREPRDPKPGGGGGALSSQNPVAAAASEVLRASRFELVDPAGTVVASWQVESSGGVQLNVLHNQHARVALGTLPDGRPFFRMDGQDGKNRMSLNLNQGDKPILVMSDERWEGRVHLGFMTPDSFPYSNWDHWGLLFRAFGSEHAVAGMGMTNTRINPAEPFLRIGGRRIR